MNMNNKKKAWAVGNLVTTVLLAQSALAREYSLDQTCYLNGNPKKCMVNIGNAGPVSKGNDIDIHISGKDTIGIKLLTNNWGRGGRVLLNNKSVGVITTSVLRNGIQYKVIRFDNGGNIEFSYGD